MIECRPILFPIKISIEVWFVSPFCWNLLTKCLSFTFLSQYQSKMDILVWKIEKKVSWGGQFCKQSLSAKLQNWTHHETCIIIRMNLRKTNTEHLFLLQMNVSNFYNICVSMHNLSEFLETFQRWWDIWISQAKILLVSFSGGKNLFKKSRLFKYLNRRSNSTNSSDFYQDGYNKYCNWLEKEFVVWFFIYSYSYPLNKFYGQLTNVLNYVHIPMVKWPLVV